jgi:hypothetical protein
VFLAEDEKDASGHGSVVGDDNHTTAEAFTKETGTIKVTFVIADLPRLSYFYVRCPDLTSSPFDSEPKIVWSAGNIALLSLDISAYGSPEYFLYRAGRHGTSLDYLPDMDMHMDRLRIDPCLVGVVPDGDGKDFVLAALAMDAGKYMLHVYRSKRGAWSEERLVPDDPPWLARRRRIVSPDKVIALQGGVLGFVDLWKGILFCDVLEERVVTAHFVPLPKLLPRNREYFNEYVPRPIRDVTCCTDGLMIRCVELEDIYRIKTCIPDASTKDVFFDYEAVDPTEEKVEEELVGWRLITWYRMISCEKCF